MWTGTVIFSGLLRLYVHSLTKYLKSNTYIFFLIEVNCVIIMHTTGVWREGHWRMAEMTGIRVRLWIFRWGKIIILYINCLVFIFNQVSCEGIRSGCGGWVRMLIWMSNISSAFTAFIPFCYFCFLIEHQTVCQVLDGFASGIINNSGR